MKNKTARQIIMKGFSNNPDTPLDIENLQFKGNRVIELMEEYAAQSKQQASAGWSDEEITALAEKEYPLPPIEGWKPDFDVFANDRTIWAKGFKAALQSSHIPEKGVVNKNT